MIPMKKKKRLKDESDMVRADEHERFLLIVYINLCNFSLFQNKILCELIQENPRAPTPDTESEQPTDTELSESKTGSSVTLEQRTPTPETEAELDEAEIAHVDSELINITKDDVSETVANCI